MTKKASSDHMEPITHLSAIPVNDDQRDLVLESDLKKTTTQNERFIDFSGAKMDLSALSNIFNSYATKKTFATGFFNLALVATNFAQMKQLLVAQTPV